VGHIFFLPCCIIAVQNVKVFFKWFHDVHVALKVTNPEASRALSVCKEPAQRDVTQNFLCTRRGAGEQREREEFVALKYGVLCVPRCTSPIKSWGGREVGSAARAQHILAKRELYFSHFLVFPIIQHLRPLALGLRRLLLKHTAAENSYACSLTHTGCCCGGKARCLLLMA